MCVSYWSLDGCSSSLFAGAAFVVAQQKVARPVRLAACQRGRERIEFRGCFADKLFVEVPRQMEAVAERSDTRDQFAIARPRGHFDEQPGGSVGIVAILRVWRRGGSAERRVGTGWDSTCRYGWAPEY